MLVRMIPVVKSAGVPVLVAFVATLVQFPAMGADKPARSTVLFVPIQRSEHVPEGVPARIWDYFKALVEIDPKLELLSAKTQEKPSPGVEKKPPVKKNPRLVSARKLAESGKKSIAKRRYESGLRRLMQAERLYRRNLADLEDFEQYVDVLLWTAVGFIDGGYMEEGAAALKKLLVMRPDLSLDPKGFSKRFTRAVNRGKKRLRKGGGLTVNITAEDAMVYVDGKLVGRGTRTVEGLIRGRHYVRVVPSDAPAAGRFVRVGGPGRSVAIAIKLKRPAKAKKHRRMPSRPLAYYAKTGDFTRSFARDASIAASSNNADYVLLGFVARSDSAFHFGLFLFDAKSGKTSAIEPAVIDKDLGNLQISLLDLESRLSKAVSSFPGGKIVEATPPIYAIAPSPGPPTVQAPPEARPPSVAVKEPAPGPKARRPSTPTHEAVAAVPPETASGGFEDIPDDFPMEEVPLEPRSTPWYEKWWVWTAIGGAVLVGAGIGLGLGLRSGDGTDTFGATARW